MIFSILACGKSGEIGNDGKLPWEEGLEKTNNITFAKLPTKFVLAPEPIATLNETRPTFRIKKSRTTEFCLGVFDWTLGRTNVTEIQKHPNNDICCWWDRWAVQLSSCRDQIFLTRIDQNFEATTYVDLDRLLYNRKLLSKEVVHGAESMF